MNRRLTVGQKNIIKHLKENEEMTADQLKEKMHCADVTDIKLALLTLLNIGLIKYRTERPTSQELLFSLKESA